MLEAHIDHIGHCMCYLVNFFILNEPVTVGTMRGGGKMVKNIASFTEGLNNSQRDISAKLIRILILVNLSIAFSVGQST